MDLAALIPQITVNTNIADVNEFLEHLLNRTNMRCLTPKQVNLQLSHGCQ